MYLVRQPRSRAAGARRRRRPRWERSPAPPASSTAAARWPVSVAAAVLGRSTIDAAQGRPAVRRPGVGRRTRSTAGSARPTWRSSGRSATPSRTPTSTGSTRERARFAAGILASALAPTNTLVGQPHRPQARLRHRRDEPGPWRTQPARRPPAHPACRARSTPARSASARTSARRPARSCSATRSSRSSSTRPPRPTVRTVPLLIVWSVINRTTSSTSPRTAASSSTPSARDCRCSSPAGATPPPSTPTGTSTPTRRRCSTPPTRSARSPAASRSAPSACAPAASCSPRSWRTCRASGDDRIAHAGVRGQPDRHVRPERRRARAAPRAARRRPARPPRPPGSSTAGRSRPSSRGCARPSWSGTSGSTTTSWARTPPQYDILAWNNDTTRVSGALQRDLLRIAMDNLLATPDGLTLLGHPGGPRCDHRRHLRRGRRDRPPRPVAGRVPLDPALRRRLDLRALRRWPHPAPGQPARQPQGPLPDRSGRRHATRRLARRLGPAAGSWWPHWADWAIARSGEERPAPKTLGSRRHPADRGGPGAVRDGAMTVRLDPRHRRPVRPGCGCSGEGQPLLLIGGVWSQVPMFDPVLPLPRRVPHHRLRPARHRRDRHAGVAPTASGASPGSRRGVLDAVGVERAHVLGVSLGGAVAQELARSLPDRVDRLVLVSTGPGAIGVPGRPDVLMRFGRPTAYTDLAELEQRRRAHLRRPAARAARSWCAAGTCGRRRA